MVSKRKSGSKRIPVVGSMVAAATLSISAHAASLSDPFGTDNALHRQTGTMVDPLGHECDAPANPLSFPGAVNFALCRNPLTRSSWALAHEQAAALGAAESAWLPDATGTADVKRDTGTYVNPLGSITPTQETSHDAALSLSWVLYDFGARTGKIANERYLMYAAAGTAVSVAQQTVRSVVQAYYGDVAADASLVAAKSIEEVTAYSLEIARALQRGGIGALGDVLQAQTAYQEAVLARLQAEAADVTAHGTLATTLGAPADQPFKLRPSPSRTSCRNSRRASPT